MSALKRVHQFKLGFVKSTSKSTLKNVYGACTNQMHKRGEEGVACTRPHIIFNVIIKYSPNLNKVILPASRLDARKNA